MANLGTRSWTTDAGGLFRSCFTIPLDENEMQAASKLHKLMRMVRKCLLIPSLLYFAAVVITPQARGEIRMLAITSAAGFMPGLPQPGSLATAFCTGLTGISGVIPANSNPLPHSIQGVGVVVGGIDAPLLAVADFGGYQQINFQVPWEATGGGPVSIAQGPDASERTFGVTPTGWAIFFTNAAKYAVAQHASDYRLVTPTDPARLGEWIVAYATNLGRVQNPPASGAMALADPLSPVLFGGAVPLLLLLSPLQSVYAETGYIGLTPGSVGVYQINFRLPENVPAGNVELQMETVRDCGFFFQQGCGRGLVRTDSLGAMLPVAR